MNGATPLSLPIMTHAIEPDAPSTSAMRGSCVVRGWWLVVGGWGLGVGGWGLVVGGWEVARLGGWRCVVGGWRSQDRLQPTTTTIDLSRLREEGELRYEPIAPYLLEKARRPREALQASSESAQQHANVDQLLRLTTLVG